MAETSSFSHTITDHSPDIFPTPKLPNLTSKDIRVLIAHVLNRFLVITKFLVLMTILSSSKAIAALANSVVQGRTTKLLQESQKQPYGDPLPASGVPATPTVSSPAAESSRQ